MWNERFAEPDFTYGKEPNDFLASLNLSEFEGQVMCLAEGQGRNAVYLAGLGFEVTAVDLSDVGLARTQELAAERGVEVHTLQADLGIFTLEAASVDGVVMIFGHTPRHIRAHIHREIIKGLKPGGFFVLEGYRKEQIAYKTGGPSVDGMLYSLEELLEDFGESMEWRLAQNQEREVVEGAYHNGLAAVVQLFGTKR
ncbi:MAG: class I SAM-dependent methyltransferase [Bacteroidia bacterium]|nr:class I SAM-dependent methyltransferase [Bacteroidia bacterium]